MSAQHTPLALRLADRLDSDDLDSDDCTDAAAELRRLHAENERLQQALRGAELGSRANFVSMQQQAALKTELLATLKGVLKIDRGTSGRIIIEGWQEDVIRAAIAKATRG